MFHLFIHGPRLSQDVKYTQENLNCEVSKLWAEKVECQQRIKDLEDDVLVLTDREKEKDLELDRCGPACYTSSEHLCDCPRANMTEVTPQAEGTTEENGQSHETRRRKEKVPAGEKFPLLL